LKNLFELFVIFIFRFMWGIEAEPFAFIASNLYIKVALDMLADDEPIEKKSNTRTFPWKKCLNCEILVFHPIYSSESNATIATKL